MKLAVAGLRKRLSNKEFGYTPPASEHRVYVDRLKYEMETLTRTGFCGYFLMVRDLMNHSRETGIPVGRSWFIRRLSGGMVHRHYQR